MTQDIRRYGFFTDVDIFTFTAPDNVTAFNVNVIAMKTMNLWWDLTRRYNASDPAIPSSSSIRIASSSSSAIISSSSKDIVSSSATISSHSSTIKTSSAPLATSSINASDTTASESNSMQKIGIIAGASCVGALVVFLVVFGVLRKKRPSNDSGEEYRRPSF